MLREFQSLRRLLCVHGTRDLSRSWTITGYSLYKSVVLCGCQTMYSLFTLFSGASLFCSLHLTFYSIVLFVFFFSFSFHFQIPIAGLIIKRVHSDEELLHNPQLYAYSNGAAPVHSQAYSVGSFIAILALALAQGVIIESVFIFCSGVSESDFLTHATFYAVYLLQDLMMILILPNFSFLHCFVNVLFHAAIAYYTNLFASSPSSELVDYFSPQ